MNDPTASPSTAHSPRPRWARAAVDRCLQAASAFAGFIAPPCDDAVPDAVPMSVRVSGEGVGPTLERNHLKNVIDEACASFYYSNVRQWAGFDPGMRFVVSQVCVRRTSETRALLREFANLGAAMRVRVMQTAMAPFPGLDGKELYAVRIEDFEPSDDAVFVVASAEGVVVRVQFEFHGSYASGGMAPDVNRPADDARTLMPPGPDATTLPVPSGESLARLEISEPGKTPRIIALQALPATIGRGRDCDVHISDNSVSRRHAVLAQAPDGTLTWTDRSLGGTLSGGKGIASDTAMPIVKPTEFVLAPTAVAGGVRVRIEPVITGLNAGPGQHTAEPDAVTLLPAHQAHSPEVPPMGAAPTLLVREPRTPRPMTAPPAAPLARLRVSLPDGRTQSHDVTDLPYVIGREINGDPHTARAGCLIDEGRAAVSRQHLSVMAVRAGAVEISNLGFGANGSYFCGERMPQRFALPLVEASSSEGWCVLGGSTPSSIAVAIRFESVAR